ncbi:hypothetical protein ACXZ65_34420 [Streptomyces aculeolatus]
MTTVLPCLGREAIYDALFDDIAPDRRAAALTEAVQLCSRCPSPCEQQVTAASGPRTAEELPLGWMPAERDGRPQYTGTESWHGTAAGLPTHGCHCPRCVMAYEAHCERQQNTALARRIQTGRSYVPAADRVDHWARWAADLNAAGWNPNDIADQLYVPLATVHLLLDHTKEITQ